jgi:anaerobic magnesium-protoporphyrin IX monomethyl ester cyclase
VKVAFVAPPVPAVPLSHMQRLYYFYLFSSRAFTVFNHLTEQDFYRFWMLEPVNLGLLQLISYLEQYDIECSFFGPISPEGKEVDREEVLLQKILKRADEFDVIGFSSITASYKTAARMASRIRQEYPDIPLILGGNHAWVRYEDVLRESVFDILVHKEGEQTTLELLQAMEQNKSLHSIAGISFVQDGKILKTPDRLRMDRSVLPLIGYEHLEDNFTSDEMGGNDRLSIPISRVTPLTGCTNDCVWCADFWKPQVTGQNPERFKEEVTYLMERRNSRFFYLGTHDFLHHLGKAMEIAAQMGALKPEMHWEAQTKVNPQATREHFRTLREADCRCIHVGVESANQELLRIMGKNIKIPEVMRMLEYAREEGIETHTYWLIGSPFETYETARQTIDTMSSWMRSGLSSTAEINMLVGYPGTGFYENKQQYDITWVDPDYSNYDGRNQPTFETTHLTKRDFEYLFHRAMDEYCSVMEDTIGSKEQVTKKLGHRFPNFDPAFMEAAF